MHATTMNESRPRATARADIRVKDVCDILGAEVTGLDVTDDRAVTEHWERIQSLLSTRQAILFRDQTLDAASLERFARRFGELERAYTQRADGSTTPPVNTIANLDKDGKPSRTPWVNTNYYWHSDRSNFANGSAMVMLHGLVLPPSGGDTQLANMELAYEGLSPEDKELVANLRAVHSFEYKRLTLEKRPLSDAERKVMPPPAVHPVVRTNPDTGRKNLYIGMYACEIIGMPVEEGRALIKRLEEHATQPRFVYTHQWRKGDFIIWDNLCLMHRGVRNYDMEQHLRVMLRCGIRSERAIR